MTEEVVHPDIKKRYRSMKLYLLRHGKADWPNWDQPDDERPLTEEGKKEVAAVAKLLSPT